MATANHNLLFGDSLEKTVANILRAAIETDTAKAYGAAYSQLRGIAMFLDQMQADGTPLYYALRALNGQIGRMYMCQSIAQAREEGQL